MPATIDGLVKALGEEAQVHQGRYLEFAKDAQDAGYVQVSKFFHAMIAAETARVNLYREYLTDLSNQRQTFEFFICPKCGVAITVSAPDECPLCQTQGAQFKRII